MAGNPETLVVDPAGDVYLNVANEIRLLVSTKVLSVCSKVFAAMFGSNFTEGQQTFSFFSPLEIDLPEDDPNAMKHLCCHLHLKHILMEQSGHSRLEILRLAIVADKYGCADALRLVSYVLRSYLEEPAHCDDIFLLMAAYHLNGAAVFSSIAAKILLLHSNSHDMLRFDAVPELVPEHVYRA